MTISQPGKKSNIIYCHSGLVLMNIIATQDCTHDPTFRHSSPSVFIRGDENSRPYILAIMTSFANKMQILLWHIATVMPILGTRMSTVELAYQR